MMQYKVTYTYGSSDLESTHERYICASVDYKIAWFQIIADVLDLLPHDAVLLRVTIS